MSEAKLTAAAERVQKALDTFGLDLTVREMPAATRTAREAAAAIGCETAQIAKSILFRAASGKPVLVIASGTNRIREAVIAERTGEPIGKATPEFVRAATGFVIGGVPPAGFPSPIETWIDEDLLSFSEIWAAAGAPFAVFRLEPGLLPRLTGGHVIRVT